MRADENLMAAAITTRRQIAGLSTAATTPRQPQGRNDRQASVCPVSGLGRQAVVSDGASAGSQWLEMALGTVRRWW
jgi:hypothetical protein